MVPRAERALRAGIAGPAPGARETRGNAGERGGTARDKRRDHARGPRGKSAGPKPTWVAADSVDFLRARGQVPAPQQSCGHVIEWFHPAMTCHMSLELKSLQWRRAMIVIAGPAMTCNDSCNTCMTGLAHTSLNKGDGRWAMGHRRWAMVVYAGTNGRLLHPRPPPPRCTQPGEKPSLGAGRPGSLRPCLAGCGRLWECAIHGGAWRPPAAGCGPPGARSPQEPSGGRESQTGHEAELRRSALCHAATPIPIPHPHTS